jgi:uncharacterized protein YxjI
MANLLALKHRSRLIIVQRHELAELLGFETRNKYEIFDENKQPVGFAAEQQKGLLGFLLRYFLGHWRRFNIQIFDAGRQPIVNANHPFRFFFQRLEIFETGGRLLGAVQQRFSVFSKKFDVQDSRGNVLLEVRSPVWRIWTFPFFRNGRQVASVSKKWSGGLVELFTDKDRFLIEFSDPNLSEDERHLILVSALFIDLQYFEHKAG